MRENLTEVLTGTLVLLIAAGFLVFAAQRTGGGAAGADYQLTASFRSVEGIGVGTDVRLAGVKVGTVTGLTLNPSTFRADATITIADSIQVPDDSSLVIASEGLLGGSFVEIEPGGSPFNYEAGDQITDTQGSVSLITLLMKFVGGGSE